jgi:hypothetical protein
MSQASEVLSNALHEFSERYCEDSKSAPDEEAQRARELVDQAKEILRTSGVGNALVPVVVEAVKLWDEPSARDDFHRHTQFPVSEVSCSKEHDAHGKKSLTVNFTYRDNAYQVKVVDDAIQARFGDTDRYGQVELRLRGDLVLGLDVSQELGKFPEWKWQDVYAFQVGDWMGDVLEMAAQIQTNLSNQIRSSREEDAIARASQIKL